MEVKMKYLEIKINKFPIIKECNNIYDMAQSLSKNS